MDRFHGGACRPLRPLVMLRLVLFRMVRLGYVRFWFQCQKVCIFNSELFQAKKAEKQKKKCPIRTNKALCLWRGRRDLNPRAAFTAYSLSRGAPSASWVLPQVENIKIMEFTYGGESGIRTHGSCESPVFRTGSLNHSDISPNRLPAQMQELSYHTGTHFVNENFALSALDFFHVLY